MTSVATPAVTPAPAAAPAARADAAGISLKDIARAHDVRFLLATFVDMTGKPCAKLVPVEAADQLEGGGAHAEALISSAAISGVVPR